jgi:hypothetical protein
LQPTFIDRAASPAPGRQTPLPKKLKRIEDEWQRFERSKAVMRSQGRKVAPE